MQHPCILKNNMVHSSKWGPLPFLSFGYQSCTLQRSRPVFRENSGCDSGIFLFGIFFSFVCCCLLLFLLLMFFLNIVSFNFVQAQNKSLRFRRLRKAMYNTMWSFQQTTAKFAPHFLAKWGLFKAATFLFLRLFVPSDNAFA